jgi:uncharacterized protein (DUF952 family)
VTLIFHITSKDAALTARHTGEYQTESLSREGFIHFSQLHQILDVANRFYMSQTGLVILAVDTTRLKATLKYEAPVHPATLAPKDEDFSRSERLNYNKPTSSDDLFPHLYGPLNFDAVLSIHDFEPGPNGIFSLPPSLPLSTDY